MKKLGRLVGLGVAAYLLFAIVTLPATVLLDRFGSAGVTAAGVDGTAWKGRAQVLQIQGVNVGTVEWDLHALALFALKLRADVKVTRPEGFAQARVDLGRSGPIDLQNLTATLPLSALTNVVPSGWSGTLNLKFANLTLENGWPIAANGTAEILDISSSNQRSPISGSYKLLFPAPNTANQAGVLTGAISDLGGPLQISGEMQLTPDRGYLIKGLVSPRPDAPQGFADQLQILGEPDAQGRRPFSLEGSL
jgi:general secretion pathway protein N